MRDILQGQEREVIMGLYNLSIFEYKSLLRNALKVGKNYFKPLISLTKADEFQLYIEWTSGASEVSLCEKYDLVLNTVIEAINRAAEEDDEHCELCGGTPLNEAGANLEPKQLTKEEQQIQDLEKLVRNKLPALLRGLN